MQHLTVVGEVVVVVEVVVMVEFVVVAEVLVVVKDKTKAMCHPLENWHRYFDCDQPVPLWVQGCNQQRHTKSKF